MKFVPLHRAQEVVLVSDGEPNEIPLMKFLHGLVGCLYTKPVDLGWRVSELSR